MRRPTQRFIRATTGLIAVALSLLPILGVNAETVHPRLVYVTSVNGQSGPGASALAVDQHGHSYVAGAGFVDEIDPSGSKVLLARPVPLDVAAIGVDQSGDIYLGGLTLTDGAPLVHPLQSTACPVQSPYVMELDPTGAIVYSSCFPQSPGFPYGEIGLVVDDVGHLTVALATDNPALPTQSAIQPTLQGHQDLYVARLDQNGQLVYATYLGGSGRGYGEADEVLWRIDHDQAGNPVIFGETDSPDFPTGSSDTQACHTTVQGAPFVVKLRATDGHVLSTACSEGLLGDASALDPAGNIYIAASRVPQGKATGEQIIEFDATAQHQVAQHALPSGYQIRQFAVDSQGTISMTGLTTGGVPLVHSLPGTSAHRRTCKAGDESYACTDAFVARMDSQGTVTFSTDLGGSKDDEGLQVVASPANTLTVAGSTASKSFPTIGPALSTTPQSSVRTFIAKIRI